MQAAQEAGSSSIAGGGAQSAGAAGGSLEAGAALVRGGEGCAGGAAPAETGRGARYPARACRRAPDQQGRLGGGPRDLRIARDV